MQAGSTDHLTMLPGRMLGAGAWSGRLGVTQCEQFVEASMQPDSAEEHCRAYSTCELEASCPRKGVDICTASSIGPSALALHEKSLGCLGSQG